MDRSRRYSNRFDSFSSSQKIIASEIKVRSREKHEIEVDKKLEIIDRRISMLEERFNKEIELLRAIYRREKSTKILRTNIKDTFVIEIPLKFYNQYGEKNKSTTIRLHKL